MSSRSYAAITESPGGRVSREGAEMLYSRYAFAAEACAGGRVLEIGCGPGLGLGLLAGSATLAVGGDFDPDLLARARDTYGSRIPLVRLDAQALPFADGCFDVALFFEGSYYVPDMDAALDEMARVLAPEGRILFVNANPERPDFIPSPLSVHYHTADEFRDALEARGFEVRVEGAWPVRAGKGGGGLMVTARTIANRLGLIPKTLAGRALLKRIVSGPLVPVPGEIPANFAGVATRSALGAGAQSGYKVLYVDAVRRPGSD